MTAIKFSEAKEITSKEEWFDPIVNFDTKLFIDPFLIFQTDFQRFDNAHQKLIKFFDVAMQVVAKSNGNKESIYYRRAKSILKFPEVTELNLGYSAQDNEGAGSGSGFAEIMVDAIWTSIAQGQSNLNHFEQLEIFNEGIGPDRISDITANILKRDFIEYTQDICRAHSIELVSIPMEHIDFDFENARWINGVTNLPKVNDKFVILVPKQFLRGTPEIYHEDFGRYLKTLDSEYLRTEFNIEISNKISKATIVALARKAPDLVKGYVGHKEEKAIGVPYDFSDDVSNFVEPYDKAKKYFTENNVQLNQASNDEEFLTVIRAICLEFKKWVEEDSGHELLVNDDGTPRNEGAAQRLFALAAMQLCRVNNIDISKETNIGRGPVDFKFSTGFSKKCLIELKKTNNSKFTKNLKSQLEAYLAAEATNIGFYLIIKVKGGLKNLEFIEGIIDEQNKNGKRIEYYVIDSTKPKSASNV